MTDKMKAELNTWNNVEDSPIPKDGSVLLLRMGCLDDYGHCTRKQYHPGTDGLTHRVTAYTIGSDSGWATHWAKLPAPPL